MKVDNSNVFTALEMILEQMDEMRQSIKLIVSPSESGEESISRSEPLDLEQVCRLTKKARSTIYRHCSKGSMPCYKNGKKLYFFRDEVMEWIRREKKQNGADFMLEAENLYPSKRVRAV